MVSIMEGWQIRLEHLSAGYAGRVVLNDLSSTIPAGKTTVILGGSGCGKSTLLRQITGLSRPFAGKVIINNQDLFNIPNHEFCRIRRRMGVLFQDGALLGSLTLAENVALPLSEHLKLDAKIIRQEALRVLALVELADFADFYPNELSGGMRKRAGLARAIIAQPQILLCDEPTSGLDPITAAKMDALLNNLHEYYPQMTIIVVSHDLDSLKTIADHAIVLREGKILFDDQAHFLQEQTDPYLQQFLRREPGQSSKQGQTVPDASVSQALEVWLQS